MKIAKKSIAILLALIMSVTCFSLIGFAEEPAVQAHLTEVPEGYIGIYTKDDLNNIRNKLNGKYILMNDIVFDDSDYELGGIFYNNGNGWNPIGTEEKSFGGIFDGNGYKIDNIFIYRPYQDNVGLFGYADSVVIKNLSLEKLDITGDGGVGGLIGQVFGESTISYCYSQGVINGGFGVGGIVGIQEVQNAVTSKKDEHSYITYCNNAATINAKRVAGGVVGESVSYHSIHYFGYTHINSCSNTGEITVSDSEAGGVVGRCYGSGPSSLNTYRNYVNYCYNISQISGPQYIGGIIGKCADASLVTFCYSVGFINSKKYFGGCFGNSPYIDQDCYYLDESVINPTCTNGTSKTEAEMKMDITYSNWNFKTIWTMGGREDYPYPELIKVPLILPEDYAHKHEYTTEITIPATHFTSGIMTYTCECGDSYTEVIEQIIEHSYEKIVTLPTCTEQGYTTYTCECGDSYVDDYVSAPGHDFDYTMSEENLTRPSESSDGYYTFTCKNGCGATETQTVKLADYSAYTEAEATIKGYLTNPDITDVAKQEIIDAIMQNAQNSEYFDENGNIRKGLTESEQNIVDTATSSAQELIDFIETKISNGEYTKPDYSEIDDRINEIDKILKDTTISDGMKSELDDIKKELKELKENENTSQSDVDEALDDLMDRLDEITSTIDNCANGNHSFVNYVITKEADCETNGIKIAACDNGCGVTDEEEIPAFGHNMIRDNAVAPNCTNTGLTEGSHCSRCDYKIVQDVIPATGHSYTSEITIPATHLEEGLMTFTCTCGDTYTEAIAKLENHNYETVVTAPTCTERGYTTYTCECGDTYIDDYVDALGHTEEIIPAVAPTCTETGLTAGAKCSACGETLTEQKELPANGHTPANTVEENYVAPTCTENGSKDIVVYCSVCKEELSRETVTLDAVGHADNDGNGYCDTCRELLDPTVECNCNCHKSGITKFFFNFILFFQKLFGSNRECACGIAHY